MEKRIVKLTRELSILRAAYYEALELYQEQEQRGTKMNPGVEAELIRRKNRYIEALKSEKGKPGK